MVEAAFLGPLFFLIVFTTIEISLVSYQKLSLANATSGAVRSASAAADSSDADYRILKDFAARGRGLDRQEIIAIVVYKAPDVDANPDNTSSLSGCKSASIPGLCNRYTASDLDRGSSDFGCGGGSVDKSWCPIDREAAIDGPPDLVGVYATIRYRSATQAFGHSYVFTSSRVLPIEPQKGDW